MFITQVFDTHYFNLLHVFGFNGGKGQYQIAVTQQNGANAAESPMVDDGEEMLDFTLRSANATASASEQHSSSNGSGGGVHGQLGRKHSDSNQSGVRTENGIT